MSQYEKLFDRAEIEYITPFLKLWMSFNNWYRKDIGDDASDAHAIAHYKAEYSPVSKKFQKLLAGGSAEDKKFQDALHFFIRGNEGGGGDYLTPPKGEHAFLYKNPTAKARKAGDLSYVSGAHQTYFYDRFDICGIIGKTLDNIYRVRCDLVRGCFDIEDKRFQGLVENSYKILYPIMDLILQEEKAFADSVKKASLDANQQ